MKFLLGGLCALAVFIVGGLGSEFSPFELRGFLAYAIVVLNILALATLMLGNDRWKLAFYGLGIIDLVAAIPVGIIVIGFFYPVSVSPSLSAAGLWTIPGSLVLKGIVSFAFARSSNEH